MTGGVGRPRWKAPGAGLEKFDEHRLRLVPKEGDAAASATFFDAVTVKPGGALEHGLEVDHLEADVMKTLTAAGKEVGHGAVAHRLYRFDGRIARFQIRQPHGAVGSRPVVHKDEAESPRVERQRGIDAAYHDAGVVSSTHPGPRGRTVGAHLLARSVDRPDVHRCPRRSDRIADQGGLRGARRPGHVLLHGDPCSGRVAGLDRFEHRRVLDKRGLEAVCGMTREIRTSGLDVALSVRWCAI